MADSSTSSTPSYSARLRFWCAASSTRQRAACQPSVCVRHWKTMKRLSLRYPCHRNAASDAACAALYVLVNRPSRDAPARRASASRVRAIPNIRTTSLSLRGSALSWPLRTRLSSAARPRNVPDQRNRRLREDAIHERIALRSPALELGLGEQRRIDLPPKLRFHWHDQLKYLAQRQILADEHQVDVALCLVRALGYRSINKCNVQFWRERVQCLLHHRLHAECLARERDEFPINRTFCICLESAQIPHSLRPHQPRLSELLQFALQRCAAQSSESKQLIDVISALRLTK